jgi:hypothetical protein
VLYVLPLALASLAGLLLLAWGLRGRLLDDHPCCRRCGYDLLGRDDATRCPECGADLGRRRARRRGRRRRRRVAIAAGSMLALLAGSAGGWIAVQASRGFDFNTIKPLWMLRLDARSGDALALGEVNNRLQAGRLEAAAVQAVVQDALAAQADPSRPWDPMWGELIEGARRAKLLATEDWRLYRRNAVTVDCRARPRIRAGDPLPVIARFTERLGTSSLLRPVAVLESPAWRPMPPQVAQPRGAGMSLLLDPACIPGPGRPTIELSWRVGSTASGLAPDDDVEQRLEPVRVEVEVRAPDDDPIELIVGEPLRAAVAESVGIRSCRAKHTIAGRRYVQVRVALEDPPVDCAFEVLLQDGHRRWRLGRIIARRAWPGDDRAGVYLDCMADDLGGPTLDLVLRPDRAAAAESMDLWRIWGEEIVIEGVRVEWW